MLKRSHYITLGLVVLLALVVLNLAGQTAARLKLAHGRLFLPCSGWPAPRSEVVGAAADRHPAASEELVKQNAQLRQEEQRLRLQALQASSRRRRECPPPATGGMARPDPWKLKLAKVVLREPANWWRSIQVDLGSRDGLQVNLPVLTTEGLVGGLLPWFDPVKVVLLGDPNCKVAARVENRNPRHRRNQRGRPPGSSN